MSATDWLHFIRPGWLLLLPLVFLLPWWWKRSRRPAGDWSRVCDPHLLKWLSVSQGGEGQRAAGRWLAGLALLITILALAGPSWQKLPDTSYSARDARVIILDLSRSMLAEDLRPNRLTRARFRLADLLASTEEGQVGLVAFAGDAYVVSPLTNDMNTIANLLPALRPDIIPVSGSRADLAMEMAASLLERSGLGRGELLLVTDSASSRDAARARDLRDDGVITSVLAVGTTEGAPIPSGGGFVSDRAGNVVIARMDRVALQDVAEAGGGQYTELGGTAGTGSLWLDLDAAAFDLRDDALGERWKDSGPYLLLLLIPLVLVGFRRGLFFAWQASLLPWILTLGGISLAIPGQAEAGWWEDLWLTRDQQAYRALQTEDAPKAAALAKDPALTGEAWYRSQEFANAGEAWNRVEGADALYNQGNALAHMGEFEAALQAYDLALEAEPGMDDAIHNREIVEQLLEQQQQEQQQQGEDGEQGEGEQSEEQEGEQSEQSQEQQEGEQQEGEQQEGEPQEGEQQEGEQQGEQQQQELVENWSEEDAQAMEQWLRRIPDDPGGLLRRKFRNQHQRRGAPEDESESW